MSDTSTETHPDSRLRTIRALLAKAENTPYPEEAETYMAKVAELVGRWGIDEALVWADDDTETRAQVTSATIIVDAPYANRKAILVDQVATALGCSAVQLGTTRSTRRICVIGFEGDVARVEILTTSLLIQLTRAMLAAGAQYDATSTAAWRRSFITAYATRIGERLSEGRTRAATEHDNANSGPGPGPQDTPDGATSAALVLAGRDEAVAAAVKGRFGRLRTVRVTDGGNRRGRDAGRDAANRAALDDSALRGPRGALAS